MDQSEFKSIAEQNEFMYGTAKPTKFDRLRHSTIVGVIDRNGVAHSKCHHTDDRPTHEELFPLIRDKRWLWTFSDGVTLSVYKDTFEPGDGDIIRNHIRREYGIRFWENGYHDLDYFLSKMTRS